MTSHYDVIALRHSFQSHKRAVLGCTKYTQGLFDSVKFVVTHFVNRLVAGIYRFYCRTLNQLQTAACVLCDNYSVCLSVRLSHLCTTSTRLNVLSSFMSTHTPIHIKQPQRSCFFHIKHRGKTFEGC